MAITGDFNIHICCAANTLGIEHISISVCDHFSIVFFLNLFYSPRPKVSSASICSRIINAPTATRLSEAFSRLSSELSHDTNILLNYFNNPWLTTLRLSGPRWNQNQSSLYILPHGVLTTPPFLKREVCKVERKWRTFKLHVLYDHLKILMKNYNA